MILVSKLVFDRAHWSRSIMEVETFVGSILIQSVCHVVKMFALPPQWKIADVIVLRICVALNWVDVIGT